jgi:uncharacterized damage-inducible protein DinB
MPPATISLADRSHAIEILAELPSQLREALRALDSDQKNTPYREDGWTVRQVVHHLADSHMTAFHRVRRALTEDNPLIPGYDEKAFAVLPDVVAPTEWSLELIESLHARWVMMLQGLEEPQWQRTMNHAERGVSTIQAATLLYAWHSRHHLAHITHLCTQQGW